MVFIRRPKTAMLISILAVLGFIIYANAIAHPFVHDDLVFIRFNPSIARWDNIAAVFLSPDNPFQSLKITTPYYRPVLEIFYRLEYAVFGMNPAGFHLFNVLLHILNAALMLFAVRLWGVHRDFAFLTALIFLIHPVQSEAVACVAGISNMAVAFFLLVSFIAYALSRRKPPGTVGLMASLTCFVIALLTKEQAVLFPLVLIAYELLRRRKRQSLASLKVPALFLVLLLVYLLWRAHLFPEHLGAAFSNSGELRLRLLLLPKTILMYIRLIVWPTGLHYYRSMDILSPVGAAHAAVLGLVVAFCAAFMRMPRRYRRPAGMGLVWGSLFLVPALNIVPLINEYSLVLTSEHFLYLSLPGLCVCLLYLASSAISRWAPHAFPSLAVATVALVLLGLATIHQNTFWRGEIPLFERTLQFEPGLGRVHFLLAKSYAEAGRGSDALDQYTRGLRIMEDYVKKSRQSEPRAIYLQYIKAAHYESGQVFLGLGELERSNTEFLRSLATRVTGFSSPELAATDSQAANDLAFNYLRIKRLDKARRFWQIAASLNSKNADALNNLGMLAFQRRDKKSALFYFQKSLKMRPGAVTTQRNLFNAQQL